jgi:hypothetical protein
VFAPANRAYATPAGTVVKDAPAIGRQTPVGFVIKDKPNGAGALFALSVVGFVVIEEGGRNRSV